MKEYETEIFKKKVFTELEKFQPKVDDKLVKIKLSNVYTTKEGGNLAIEKTMKSILHTMEKFM